MRGTMTRAAAFLGALLAVSDFSQPARAQQVPDCKACAAERKICRQAHSQQACDSEYGICIKYCVRKPEPSRR
jgi:hypothetical protein